MKKVWIGTSEFKFNFRSESMADENVEELLNTLKNVNNLNYITLPSVDKSFVIIPGDVVRNSVFKITDES